MNNNNELQAARA